MTTRIPAAFVLALGAFGLCGVSCTVILAPRDDVQRCGTADDCDPTGDNRYVPVCKFDDANVDLDSSQVDKICVADFKDIGCDPGSYTDPNHVYNIAINELGDSSRYAACEVDQLGSFGCKPMGGSCAAGLAVNDLGVCDDDDPTTPKAVIAETSELIGQDVRDQFCRSFFCDDRFVCDNGTCAVCSDDEPYGEGGCGDIYIAGARSCVYEDGGACEAEDASVDTVTFGCG